jgi:hypothetical protein
LVENNLLANQYIHAARPGFMSRKKTQIIGQPVTHWVMVLNAKIKNIPTKSEISINKKLELQPCKVGGVPYKH